MIEDVKACVANLLREDKTSHGMEHINRVLKMALKFCDEEKVNQEIVALIALLHDVDDYKLFGEKCEENQTNAKTILSNCPITDKEKELILNGIKTIGYSKRLKGIVPTVKEAMIVSDADMCDAIGATGILRTHQYNLAHGYPFFNPDVWPDIDMTPTEYLTKSNRNVVNHMFEKLLRLKDLMLTEPGIREASVRHEIMVNFLYQYFLEVNALEWKEYLDKYLASGINRIRTKTDK